MTMRATVSDELESIAGFLHDRWFDLEEVRLDNTRNELRVPFLDRRPGSGRIRRRLAGRAEEGPQVAGELVVSNVVGYSIDDRAGVRWFDFKWISYDDQTRRLSIRSNMPLEVLIIVEDLDVSLMIE
jgi:hypothetical protein